MNLYSRLDVLLPVLLFRSAHAAEIVERAGGLLKGMLRARQEPAESIGDTAAVVVSTAHPSLTVVEVVATASPSTSPSEVVVKQTVTASQPLPKTIPTITTTATPTTLRISTSRADEPTATCDAGLYLCADEFNGGCCLTGFTCAEDTCIPPPTVTNARVCLPGYFLCPPELNGGCCPDSYHCDPSSCIPPTGAQTIARTKSSDLPVSTKLSAVPINYSPTSSPPSPSPEPRGLSTAVIGGISAAVIVAVLAIAFVGCFTFRRVRGRGNTDPFWRRSKSQETLGAPTANCYHPHAPQTRYPRGRQESATYQPVRSDVSPLPSPGMLATSPHPDGFDFGFTSSTSGMHSRSVSGSGEDSHQTTPLDSLSGVQLQSAEMPQYPYETVEMDGSSSPRWRMDHAHEVEGDGPEMPHTRKPSKKKQWIEDILKKFGKGRSTEHNTHF